MKILYYLERWSSGGIEAFVANILDRTLDGENVSADIAAHRLEDSIFTERLKRRGVRFYELSGSIRSPKNAPQFKALLRENCYDAVHFNVFHSWSFRMVRLARLAGVPVRIVHAHGAGLRDLPGSGAKTALSKLGQKLWSDEMTCRLACSTEASRFIFGDESAIILKNGIDCERFAFSEEKRRLIRERLCPRGELLLGHVGRFSEEKNHTFLLDILDEAVKIDSSVRLVLIGDGPKLGETEELIRVRGLSDRITLLGAVANIEDYLSAMDVFLFPSTAEGFGIAAIEAQASGLPTLISDAVPPAAMLTENAVMLPLNDAKAWVREAFSRVKAQKDRKDEYKRIGAAGYDVEQTARTLRRIYGGGK